MNSSVFNYSEARVSWEEWLEDLRGVVANSRRELGVTHHRLAQDANILLITVELFANGTTKRPHARTISEICRVLYRSAHVAKPEPKVVSTTPRMVRQSSGAARIMSSRHRVRPLRASVRRAVG